MDKTASWGVRVASSGEVFVIKAADLVASLPPTQAGLKFTFRIHADALSAGTGFSISPWPTDKIMGNGFEATDDKDAINTGATDAEGDLFEIEGDGDLGWYVERVIGTWEREV